MGFNPETFLEKEVSPETELEEKKVYGLVEGMLKNRINLGEGRAGKVFTSPNQSICVKQITDSNPEFSSNNVREEMGFLAEAVSAGVRVPKPVLSLRLKKEGDFIVMETIKGSSIRDIYEGRAGLPDTYDHDHFWDSLSLMVRRLNNNNIYHRDLHEGNVMIENETGEPVIIDFGLSTSAFGDEDPFRVVDFPYPGNIFIFKRDEDQVTALRQKMIRYLQNKKSSI